MGRLRTEGHRRIGFLTRRHPEETSGAYRRQSAYIECLSRLGLPFNEHDIVQLDSATPDATAEGHNRVVDRLREGVTAWMCASDLQAYDLIAALRKRGYGVPDHVSVTGFDGSPRPMGAPALETVRVPYYEIGFAAGRRLFDKIAKRFDSRQEILLEGRVEEGETVGPPRIMEDALRPVLATHPH